MGRSSVPAPRTQGGATPKEASIPRGGSKARPAHAEGGVSANEACVNKGGKKYPPTEGGGACDRIATGAEAS